MENGVARADAGERGGENRAPSAGRAATAARIKRVLSAKSATSRSKSSPLMAKNRFNQSWLHDHINDPYVKM
ncbi:MAG TPA: hypothetical protein VJS30_25970, partial [Paraburkholderia sp.]|nr:hypothetical protein [Paraburkholderia sp.]